MDLVQTATAGDVDRKFNAIMFCGAVESLPTELAEKLLDADGSLVAPVRVAPETQQLQVLTRKTVDAGTELRKITDFGVIFEPVK